MRTDLIARGEDSRKRVLDFVRAFVASKGYGPTFAEIAAGVDMSSTNAVSAHVHRLQLDGYLVMEPRLSRSMRLISPAPDGWTS